MNYYLDTEFHEYFRKPFLGKKRHVVDLISIGIVAEDGREYYAICEDFDLKAAWNNWQPKKISPSIQRIFAWEDSVPEYWLRENVLKPIWKELRARYLAETEAYWGSYMYARSEAVPFSLSALKMLIGRYGKTRKQIAKEIKDFIHAPYREEWINTVDVIVSFDKFIKTKPDAQFYGYYADYDWVVFCSLFGRMADLPKGFPMYCRDLQQTKQEVFDARRVGREISDEHIKSEIRPNPYGPSYPQNPSEHNALADARWNKGLHEYLQSISKNLSIHG